MKVEIEHFGIDLTVDTRNECVYAGWVDITELIADKIHADIVQAAIEAAYEAELESEPDYDDIRDFTNDLNRLIQ